MRLPPEVHKKLYDQARAQLLAGQREAESRHADNPVTLSLWIRIGKLAARVGDLSKVLAALRVTPHEYREADGRWRSLFDVTPEIHAAYDFLNERIDVHEEAARIAASPGPSTEAPLAPDAAVLLGSDGRLRLVGHRLVEGKVQLRAVDLETRAVLWEGGAGALAWTSPPSFQRFTVLGPRVALVHEERVHLLDGQEGRLLWSASVPYRADLAEHSPPAVLDPLPPGGPGVLVLDVVRDQGSVLVALDRDTGAPVWTHELTQNRGQVLFEVPGVGVAVSFQPEQRFPPSPPGPGDALQRDLHPEGSWIGVLDARSGALLWRAALPGLVDRRAPWNGLFRDMIVIEHFAEGALFLSFLDARTGAPRERVRRVASTPILAMLDTGAGPLWLGRMGEPSLPSAPLGFGWAAPSPDPAAQRRGEKLEAGSISRFELARQPGQARLAGGAIVVTLPPVLALGAAASPPALLVAFDLATLAPRFQIPLAGSAAVEARRLAVRDPLVVIADAAPESFTLLAIDARTGRRVWSVLTEPVVAIHFAGDYLVARRSDGGLAAYRAADGSLLGRWP